jgi:BlaI family transcriptional regulator, penicillinase repressor
MDGATLGERELDVMAVLWEIGSGTVSEVRERLSVKLAYTTVLTVLRNLEVKEFVSHESEGRAHRYIPRLQQRTVRRSALSRLLDVLFEGSQEQLLANLVDDRALTAGEVQRLARRVREQGKKRKGVR